MKTAYLPDNIPTERPVYLVFYPIVTYKLPGNLPHFFAFLGMQIAPLATR
jgi:hypothetical protein